MKKLKTFLQKNPQIRWLLGYIPLYLAYFLTQQLPLEHTVIHLALDDAIPFLPIFILPYFGWYLYISVLPVVVCFRDRQAFVRQCVTMYIIMAAAILTFVIFPTAIDFTPDASGNGLLLWLCRWIYSHDRPVNVLPSMHCTQAVGIYLTTFCGSTLRKYRGLRIAAAVLAALICLSTVFVRQHSVLDGVIGVALASAVYALVRKLWKDS